MYRYSNGQISLADFKQPIGMNLKEDVRDWYFVHYNPFGYFTMVQSEGLHVIYLSMKKLREICGKYPSKDRIFLQYMQFLDEQTSKIKTTMRKPMKQWDDENRFDAILTDYLAHVTDEKPITARQCIKALVQVGKAKPRYIPKIIDCFHIADLSKYKDSMRPLIERDIAKAERALTL